MSKTTGFIRLLAPVLADYGVQAKLDKPYSQRFGNTKYDLSKDGESLGYVEFVEEGEEEGEEPCFSINGWFDSGDEAGWEFYDLQDMDVAGLYEQNPELNELVPDTTDYGIESINAFATLLAAILKLLEQGGTDFENLYEHGGYKLHITLRTADGEITTGYWVEATSSEDARQRVKEEMGDKLLRVEVVGFRSPQQFMADHLDEPEDYPGGQNDQEET